MKIPEMLAWRTVLIDLWHEDLIRFRQEQRRQFFLEWAFQLTEELVARKAL